MQKQAISLIEVMISISLISVVIASVLHMQQNNLYYLEKFKDSSLYNSYISFALASDDNKRNKNIYLDDIFDFEDDYIRRELKLIKVNIKDEPQEDIQLPKNEFVNSAKITKTIYSIEGKASKEFYSFKLDD